jgi:integrase
VGSNPTPRTKVGPLAVVWELKKQGRKETTLQSISKRLRYLNKKVDLDDPEKVKEYIANLQCTDGYKDNLIDAYSHYAKFCKIHWTKPKYMREERITRVPKEEDINKIISHAKLKSASAYSIMRDTGLRPVELGMLRVKDIALETGKIYPITAKHGSGRVLKMRSFTLAMLKKYLNESKLGPNDHLWNTKRLRQNWYRLKVSVAKKLGEPQLAQIRLYDLRHFAGSMAYYRTKDIIYTMRFLGHKNIKNTLRYVHLVGFDREEYLCKVANDISEVTSLIEDGFEFVCKMNGNHVFRKRK